MNWKDALVAPGATIRDAMAAIDKASIQMCLILDDDQGLIGAVTDGDIRRAMLRGASLDTPALQIVGGAPFTESVTASSEALERHMRVRKIRQIPLLDEANRVVDVAYIDNLYSLSERRPNDVILMAGGMGKRLRPLTENLPKPMLKVGEKPILETIISRFVDQGFQSFKVSLNYHANTIRDYFGDGKRFDAEIEYLEEATPFGTAGAISLLAEPPTSPVIVMNGDVLTQVDFLSLLTYHEEHNAVATMALREFGMQVPFGVVDVDNNRVTALHEKPNKQFLVNAGIYVLSPTAVGLVPTDRPSDMTDLFQTLIDTDQNVAAFPIHEYWMDVGRLDDLQKATDDFSRIFE